MPLAGRAVAAAVGALFVITAAWSVIGTIIVPRPVGTLLTRLVDRLVNGVFRIVVAPIANYRRRDRLLAAQAPIILLAQLLAWLGIFFVGYALLLWPTLSAGITRAFTSAGPALWEIGSVQVHGAPSRTILDVASLTGIVTITLQIAYLPTLYSAFNRRETEVARVWLFWSELMVWLWRGLVLVRLPFPMVLMCEIGTAGREASGGRVRAG